jgi:hypothetical protein
MRVELARGFAFVAAIKAIKPDKRLGVGMTALPKPERFSLTLARMGKSHSEFALNGDFLLEIWGTVR